MWIPEQYRTKPKQGNAKFCMAEERQNDQPAPDSSADDLLDAAATEDIDALLASASSLAAELKDDLGEDGQENAPQESPNSPVDSEEDVTDSVDHKLAEMEQLLDDTNNELGQDENQGDDESDDRDTESVTTASTEKTDNLDDSENTPASLDLEKKPQDQEEKAAQEAQTAAPPRENVDSEDGEFNLDTSIDDFKAAAAALEPSEKESAKRDLDADLSAEIDAATASSASDHGSSKGIDFDESEFEGDTDDLPSLDDKEPSQSPPKSQPKQNANETAKTDDDKNVSEEDEEDASPSVSVVGRILQKITGRFNPILMILASFVATGLEIIDRPFARISERFRILIGYIAIATLATTAVVFVLAALAS